MCQNVTLEPNLCKDIILRRLKFTLYILCSTCTWQFGGGGGADDDWESTPSGGASGGFGGGGFGGGSTAVDDESWDWWEYTDTYENNFLLEI